MKKRERTPDEMPKTFSVRGRGRRFSLYASSLGRYSFREIRDVLAAGLVELGFEIELRDETRGFSEDADWHVVVAPHEFLYLGRGRKLRRRKIPPNLILVNTEQPPHPRSSVAYALSGKVHRLWDVRYDLAHHMSARGIRCDYLPLGYVSSQNVPMEARRLPHANQSAFLEPAVLNGSYYNRLLRDRPIDVLFVGALTTRRDEFFATASPVLSDYRCHFDFLVESDPQFPEEIRHIDGTIAAGLAQRSKVIVNLHRGNDLDFEWRRIVMYGIWQQAFVLSEECTIAPPFRPQVDYIEVPLEKIPNKLVYYLSTSEGMEEAQATALRGNQTLKENCKMKDHLRPLIADLYSPETPRRFRHAPVSMKDTSR